MDNKIVRKQNLLCHNHSFLVENYRFLAGAHNVHGYPLSVEILLSYNPTREVSSHLLIYSDGYETPDEFTIEGLERKLKQVPGVENVKASQPKNEVEVTCSENVSIVQLENAIKDKGYSLTSDNSGQFIVNDKSRWKEIGSVLVVMIGAHRACF